MPPSSGAERSIRAAGSLCPLDRPPASPGPLLPLSFLEILLAQPSILGGTEPLVGRPASHLTGWIVSLWGPDIVPSLQKGELSPRGAGMPDTQLLVDQMQTAGFSASASPPMTMGLLTSWQPSVLCGPHLTLNTGRAGSALQVSRLGPGTLCCNARPWTSISSSNKVHRNSAQSLRRVRLLGALWTAARQAPLSLGFPRQECWSGPSLPSPGDLLNPGIKHACAALTGGFFTI